MKRVPITEEQEEIEIDDVVEFIINHHCSDKYLKKRKFKNFIEDTLDPKEKIIIRGYDEYGKIINHRISIPEANVSFSDKFIGKNLKKIKLQVRLETDEDIEKLVKFLNFIKPCLNQTQEESINNNRKKVLNDILDDDTEFIIPKMKLNF